MFINDDEWSSRIEWQYALRSTFIIAEGTGSVIVLSAEQNWTQGSVLRDKTVFGSFWYQPDLCSRGQSG
jgi:hypothetical protein